MRARTVVMVVLLSLALPLSAATLPEDRPERDAVQRLLTQAAAQVDKGAIGTIRLGTEPPEPILAFSWGVQNVGDPTGGGGGAGKAIMEDLHFVKPVSQGSAKLFLNCAQGKHIPTATLEITNSKGQPYLQIKMTDVFISSYQIGGDGSVDATSLQYGSAEYILIGL
jgi:hypothetical protein